MAQTGAAHGLPLHRSSAPSAVNTPYTMTARMPTGTSSGKCSMTPPSAAISSLKLDGRNIRYYTKRTTRTPRILHEQSQ